LRDAEVIGLVIVAETRLYREGLARALDEDDRFCVVGTAGDVGTAIELINSAASGAEVLLLDHSVPEGASAVRRLHQASPELRVVALAVHEADDDVLPWAEAGVVGFVSHDVPLDDLRATLATVADGCALCSPRLAAVLLHRVAALSHERVAAIDLSELTARETEIAMLLDEGLSNKEIALRLGIKIATVKNHVHSILGKLEVRRRGEAAHAVRACGRSTSRGGGI
jgi:two-component system, NarL family, nitrate/nitrite response regulator NarL